MAKVEQKLAEYNLKPMENFCSECENFVPENSCRVVEGKIDPKGSCKFFSGLLEAETPDMQNFMAGGLNATGI